MPEKSSPTITRKHPRIPLTHGEIQVNYCKSPTCVNYSVAAKQRSVRGYNRYTLDRLKGITSCICTACGIGFPLKSNLGISEEIERMTSYLSPPDDAFCQNKLCANYANQIPVSIAGAYASFGKTAIGNPRWRCRICGKTFSKNTKATARQRTPHKNKTIFKLLVNKMPVRRILEVTEIAPQTFYHRLAFFHRQCQSFAAHRERALASLAIRRLYLSIDRQDYLVNWRARKDKRNVQLSAIATVDNEYGYCFGTHLNFDPILDAKAIKNEAQVNGDFHLPNPHRRFARLWLDTNYDATSSRSITPRLHKLGLSEAIDDAYATALTRSDIESPDAPSPMKQLPEYGMQIHGEYTMYGHFFFLKRLLGNVQKWRFFLDQDPGLRAACLSAFHDEVRDHTADAFYVSINKKLTVDEKRQKYNDAKAAFEQAKASQSGMRPDQVKLKMITERLATMTTRGKWKDQWFDHPFPTMGEPEKAVACLTNIDSYDTEHKAWLYNKASLHAVDSFFNQIRRRLSLLERPIRSKSNKGRVWNGYSPYDPGNVTKLLNIMRTVHNYILPGKDGKTPAMRLGLARAPLDYEDIIYFS
jgi:transposase-like protein